MTDRELMQQALEALEWCFSNTGFVDPDSTMKNLRERLAQPVQEPVAMRYDFDGYGYKYIDSGSGSNWQTRIKDAEPLYAAPVVPVQEPVAWTQPGSLGEYVSMHRDEYHTVPLYTTPQPVQEPVSGVVIREGRPSLLQDRHIKPTDQRLYITPPRREWVGLTDEDVMELFTNLVVLKQDYKDPVDAFKAICVASDAKLREKNT